ncbi:MAG: hypothetical protein JWO44_376 [Bacteroidetes bacterium]|jgi:hypothetical protein|nr:hypothetical protein [Bacteroidota bacterium]
MKTKTLSVLGILLLSSGITFAQVNNGVNININSDTVKTNNNTDTVKVIHDTIKQVQVVPAPAPAPAPPAEPEKKEPPFKSGEIGLRFMPTFSTFNLRNPDGSTVNGELAMSYGYGGMLGINSKHVGLQLEVIYNEISQKYKDKDLERRIDINYLNIPLLLTLNTDKSKPVNFGVAIGPQVGVNVGSRVTTQGGSTADTLQATVALKKADVGFAYGAGFDFALNKMRTIKLNLGFRGVYGLVDISDNSKTKTTNSYYILDRTNVETYSGYLGLSFVF